MPNVQSADAQIVVNRFAAAEKLFRSPEHERAATSFQELIELLLPRGQSLSGELRGILVRSLAYHAEIMLNLDRTVDARRDQRVLLKIDPTFEPGEDLSEDFRLTLAEVRAEKSAIPPTQPTEPVVIRPPPAPTPTITEPEQRAVASSPSWLSRPPRLLLLRGNGIYQTHMEPFFSNAVFLINGRVAQANATYDLDKKGAPDGYELGVTVRLWKVSVGITRSKVSYPQAAVVDAVVPHPTFGYTRNTEGTITNITRTEEATHFELGVSIGSEAFEMVAFAGPSWLSATQEIITRVSVLEESAGPSITGATGQEQSGQARIGFNFGVDLSWMFAKYLGVGAIARYVRSDVDFEDNIGGVSNLIIGGGTLGAGLRLRF